MGQRTWDVWGRPISDQPSWSPLYWGSAGAWWKLFKGGCLCKTFCGTQRTGSGAPWIWCRGDGAGFKGNISSGIWGVRKRRKSGGSDGGIQPDERSAVLWKQTSADRYSEKRMGIFGACDVRLLGNPWFPWGTSCDRHCDWIGCDGDE